MAVGEESVSQNALLLRFNSSDLSIYDSNFLSCSNLLTTGMPYFSSEFFQFIQIEFSSTDQFYAIFIQHSSVVARDVSVSGLAKLNVTDLQPQYFSFINVGSSAGTFDSAV